MAMTRPASVKMDYISSDTTDLQAYWRLYCEQRRALTLHSPKLLSRTTLRC
jgi:hypothetical protein